jgi:hypothetical protein
MNQVAVFIPVGPAKEDLERLREITCALHAVVPVGVQLLIIDDGGHGQAISEHAEWPSELLTVLAGAGGTQVSMPNDRMAATTIQFLDWLASSDCDFGVKLDTDAMVLRDFRDQLAVTFQDPGIGLCGACDRNVADGPIRDVTLWRHQLLNASSPVQIRLRSGRPRFRLAIGNAGRSARFLRRALWDARGNDYHLGRHCLGGAYAVSAAAARQLAGAGWLADPTITSGTGLGEDVLLGLLVSAAGFRMKTLVAPGDPFAVVHRGLPAEPNRLVTDGYAIVHSLKCDEVGAERTLRAEFERLREGQLTTHQDPRAC